jgi:hypothetical protein
MRAHRPSKKERGQESDSDEFEVPVSRAKEVELKASSKGI